MTVTTTRRRTARDATPVLRVAGAAALLAMAWIHWHLRRIGFASVPTIGPLFLLDAVAGVVAALVLLATPRRWLAPVELACALLLLGTLGALLASMTAGLFGFRESWDAPLVRRTVAVEAAGGLLLLAAALRHGVALPSRRRR